MNKLLTGFLEKATKDQDPDDREWVFSTVDQEKFAKLIIKEYADLCLNSGYEFGDIFSKMGKEHFGIK